MSEENMNNTAVEHEYGADQIQILEGLEAVRKRPGMYIGTTSSRGLHHLVYEIVDNAVDEHLAGYCSRIHVVLEKDGSCTVEDNGRGSRWICMPREYLRSVLFLQPFMQAVSLTIPHIRQAADFMV